MWGEILRILKIPVLIGVTISALTIFGNVINTWFTSLGIWTILTNFFIILRFSISLFDFMWDTDTMFVLIGVALIIEVAYWVFRGAMLLIHYFRAGGGH